MSCLTEKIVQLIYLYYLLAREVLQIIQFQWVIHFSSHLHAGVRNISHTYLGFEGQECEGLKMVVGMRRS